MKVSVNKRSGIFVFVVVASIVIISLNQCGDKLQSGSTVKYKDISSDELKAMMNKEELCLINVHIPYEGEISETDMYIPYTEIGEKLDLPKESMIVVYCRSGSMSKSAAEKLVELGYTNVFNLRDGMIEWQQRGNRLLFRPEHRDR